jgi:predicted N-acetyltransferase YhbS
MFRLAYMADHPTFIPTLAKWHFAEWGHLRPGDSIERRIIRLTEASRRREIPTVVIARDGEQLLGAAMLVANDMSMRPDLIPWIAGVFVAPEQRGQGIGAALVQRVIAEAKALQQPRLYLYTFSTEKYYERLGWELVERTNYLGSEVTIMSYDCTK